MTIQQFDSAICRLIDEAIEAALKPLAELHGIEIKIASGRYSARCYAVKLEILTRDAAGNVHHPGADSFRALAKFYGLESDDLGREFQQGRVRYRITGLNTKRPRYPISVERVNDGKRFKMPADQIRQALGRAAPERVVDVSGSKGTG